MARRKFQILVEIDEGKLKEATDLDEIQDICEVIKSEMSWVQGSGIYVTKVQPNDKKQKQETRKVRATTPGIRCKYCGHNPMSEF